MRLMYAMNEVSRETQYGMILEKMMSGLIKNFEEEDLEMAYELYKSIVEQDLKSGFVTIPVLKLSRDQD
jgi:hypothetical protein